MINHFRNILLNVAPVTANVDPNVDGYMYVDPEYVAKALTDSALVIHAMLFTNCTTANDYIARATTIFKIVDNSMLGDIITEKDTRVTGQYAATETELTVVTELLDAITNTVLGSTDKIFIGRDLYTEHAFFRSEPLERIAGFACVLVDYITTTRKL